MRTALSVILLCIAPSAFADGGVPYGTGCYGGSSPTTTSGGSYVLCYCGCSSY